MKQKELLQLRECGVRVSRLAIAVQNTSAPLSMSIVHGRLVGGGLRTPLWGHPPHSPPPPLPARSAKVDAWKQWHVTNLLYFCPTVLPSASSGYSIRRLSFTQFVTPVIGIPFSAPFWYISSSRWFLGLPLGRFPLAGSRVLYSRHVIGENKNQWKHFPKIKKCPATRYRPPQPVCPPSPQHLVLMEGCSTDHGNVAVFILPIKLVHQMSG